MKGIGRGLEAGPGARRGASLLRLLLLVYLCALVPSWFVMGWTRDEPSVPSGRHTRNVPRLDAEGRPIDSADDVRIAFREFGILGENRHETPLLLLHGSPGTVGDFRDIAEILAAHRPVLVPDMPGFGASTRDVPNYSVRAHAGYALELLDTVGVERVHVVGFSMGTGVGLEMADRAPERVDSLTMLAGIGVEELELLGQHELNHGLHGLQVLGLRLARWLIPHYGALDRSILTPEYARNFYDTDQSRLRPLLESFQAPMLILHGEDDFLVPVEAAREHARIVPQAALRVFPAPHGHFLPWKPRDPANQGVYRDVAEEIVAFTRDVDRGDVPGRDQALSGRVQAANAPFDPGTLPPFEGPALLTVLLLLAAATLVSEDLACIAAGLLVADGRIGFIAASAACFAGIFVGDMALYWLGRTFGRPALTRAPLTWIVDESAVDRASRWFERKGIAVIFLSRFTPGLRLPTYVAAGVLRTRVKAFAFFFAVAGVLWTPLLVGIAAVAGEKLSEFVGDLGVRQLPWILALALALFQLYRTLPLLFTHRGRRILRGRWLRWTRWEFWPPWITYLPVLLWIACLAIRHRGLSKVTACNPAMPAGGFVGESKSAIFGGFDEGCVAIPAFLKMRASESAASRVARARAFVAENGPAGLPVILKPDAGQRGSGVVSISNEHELEERIAHLEHDAILQERVDGAEFGVFWILEPGADRGRILSITEKVLPTVTGDGERTVEDLILDDPRACAMHQVYARELAERVDDIPAAGEEIRLVDVGTHARGAIFLDGAAHSTEALRAAIDEIARAYEGFDFGRFDVRAPDAEAFARGEQIRVLEVNGVTSESTDVYDPKHSVAHAYRVWFEQWSIAYRIGAENARRGVPTTSLWQILTDWWSYRRSQRSHAPPRSPSAQETAQRDQPSQPAP